MAIQNSGKTVGQANLRSWKPGQSGNPGGRPRRDPVTEELRRQLTPEMAADIASALLLLALHPKRNQLAAIREVMDRVEGKSIARTESGGRDAFDPIGAALDGYSVAELKGMLTVLRDQAAQEGLITEAPGRLLPPKIEISAGVRTSG